MGILKEFKEFAVKGNMVDMAVGIVVGAAFNQVVDVLVKQIVMPPLSLLTNEIQFPDKKIILRDAILNADGTQKFEEVAIGYGALMESVINFLIIGFTIFLVVKLMNTIKKRAEDPKDVREKTPKDIQLLDNLKDLMEEQNKLLTKVANKD